MEQTLWGAIRDVLQTGPTDAWADIDGVILMYELVDYSCMYVHIPYDGGDPMVAFQEDVKADWWKGEDLWGQAWFTLRNMADPDELKASEEILLIMFTWFRAHINKLTWVTMLTPGGGRK